MVRMMWMQCVCAMMLTAGSALSRQRPSGSSSFVKQVIVCILYAVEGLHLLIYIYKIYLSEKGGKRKMVRPCVLVGLNKDKRDAVTGNKGRVSSALRVHVHDPQCCCVSQKIMGGNRGLFTDTVETIEAHYRYCRGTSRARRCRPVYDTLPPGPCRAQDAHHNYCNPPRGNIT